MALGPVLRYELLTTSRRPRYYLMRLLYGLLLLLLLLQRVNRPPDGNHGYVPYIVMNTQTSMRYLAESIFASIAGLQAIVLVLITPALVAGLIADEARRKTLYDLFSSGLSSASIVLGKLAARLVHALVLIAIGLPVVAIVELLGGLDPRLVAFVYLGTLSTVYAIGGLSMLVSVLARSPREALLVAYTFLIAWLIGPPLMGPFLSVMYSWDSIPNLVNRGLAASNPIWITSKMLELAGLRQYYGGGITQQWIVNTQSELESQFHWLIGLQMGMGSLALLLSIVLLRPVRGFGDGSGRIHWKNQLGKRFNARVRTSRVIYNRKPCGEFPMFWKERRATLRGGLAWLASRPLALIVGIIVACFFFEASLPAFQEMANSLRGGFESNHARRYLNQMIRDVGIYVFSLWLVMIASAGAVSVTEEKESDTWISLTATLLTAREIVLGKIFGAIWSAHWIGLTLMSIIVLGFLSGALHPLGALLSTLGLFIYGTFAASLGIAISLRAKTSPRALLWTMTILAALNVGVLSIVGYSQSRFDARIPYYSAVVAPLVERVSLLSYQDFQVDGFQRNPGFNEIPRIDIRSAFILITISYGIYGTAAWYLIRRSIRSFDVAVDRPRLKK